MTPRLFFLIFTLLLSPALGEPSRFFENRLEVEVPSILRSLDEEAIEEMFATARTRPGVVLATPDSETRISMTYAGVPLDVDSLEPTMQSLKARMDEQPGLKWVGNGMLTLQGQPWFRLDYEVPGESGDKHEIILGTSIEGSLLFIVMAIPKDDLPLIGEELQQMIDSLKVLKP